MNLEYPEIRQSMTEKGYEMTDKQYSTIVSYARHKAEAAGKDEAYLPYLLPDVIREWFIQRAINSFTMGLMGLEKLKEVEEGGRTASTAAGTK